MGNKKDIKWWVIRLDINNIDWDKLKKDKEQLLELLKEYGSQSKLADVSGLKRTTIRYWVEKYNITAEDYSNVKEEKEAPDRENKPDYEKAGSHYIIYSSDRNYVVEEDLVDEFLQLYCQAGYTMNDVATELEIGRDKVSAMWSAFDITHGSIPHREEELKERGPEELAKNDVRRDKKLYWKLIEKEKEKKAYKELKKYYKKEYLTLKAVDRIADRIESFEYREPRNIITRDRNKISLIVNISDWHKGKLVSEYKLIDENISGYNSRDIFDERMHKYMLNVKEMIEYYKPEKVYILNYGDGPDDPNHDTYLTQYMNQDIYGEDQFVSYLESLMEFVLFIEDMHDNIVYSGVPGNHSKGAVNWDALGNLLLAKFLSEYDIDFDVENRKHKVHEIYNSYLIQLHGDKLRRGRSSQENDILNLVTMAGLPLSQTYVVHGHEHHYEKEGTKYKHIKLPSMVGGDDLSAEMMYVSSRPAQVCFLIGDEGMKSEHYIYFD
jgi:hypothetical protein